MKTSFLLFLTCVFFLASCTNFNRVQSASDTIAVTDFRGKEVKIIKPAERVICLIESALSGIYMLYQQNRVVGVPSAIYGENLYQYYSRLDTRVLNRALPSPGNWDFVSIEQVVGLKPDLVIIWSSQTDAIESLEQFNIPVYAVMLNSFSDIYKEIEDLGILLDCSDRSDSLVALSKGNMETIHKNNENIKSAYFMWSQGITETSGKNSTVNELLKAAGVINACNLFDEHVSVSVEKIYDWDPDMIIMWYNEKLDPVDVLNDPLLQGLRAVKEGKVYELPEVFACDFWTLKMQYPVQLISKWAYDSNLDTNMQKQLVNKMYKQLYGIELIN